MKPTLKVILGTIIFFIFGLIPVARADFTPTPEGFENAVRVFCGDPAEISDRSLDPGEQADYYYVSGNDLAVGQVLTIDVDTADDGATLDTILEVYLDSDPDTNTDTEKPIAVAELTSLLPLNEDPYLELPIDVLGTYYLVIYDETGENKTGAYTLSLKCADPSSIPDPVPVEVGDLLGFTSGSIVKINPADGTSDVRFTPLGVGSIADLEYQSNTRTLFVAVNENPGSIIAVNPDSGALVQTFNLVSDSGTVVPRVVALEAGENMLYGVQTDPSGEQFTLVLVTMDVESGTATLTPVVSFPWPVRALAFNQSERMLYGASGTDLVRIDLTTSPAVVEKAALTGLSFTITALDFNQEDVLYGVDVSGNLLKIDHASRQVLESIPIQNSAAVTTTLASADPSASVSGLTFVVGDPPVVDPIKTICSSSLTDQTAESSESLNPRLKRLQLKRNPLHGAIGLFKFEGKADEILSLIRVESEEQDPAEAEENSKFSWLEKLLPGCNSKGRVFVSIRDAIPGVKFRVTNKGELPLEMTDVHLPADGWYYLMVIRPLPRFYQSDYCLTLKSEDPESKAWETLEVAWPTDESAQDGALTSDEAQTAEFLNDESAEEPVSETTVESPTAGAPAIEEETTVEPSSEVVAPAEEPASETTVESPTTGAPAIGEETTVEPSSEVVASAEEPASGTTDESTMAGAPAIEEETTVEPSSEVVAPAEEPASETTDESAMVGAPAIEE